MNLSTLRLTLIALLFFSSSIALAQRPPKGPPPPGGVTCRTDGPNPCCAWNPTGDCTSADAKNAFCNDVDSATGAYSAQCKQYLVDNAGTYSWMISAADAMHDYVAAQATDLVTAGMSLHDVTRPGGVADGILYNPWASDFDVSDGKCMSVGFATGTYIGLYNCQSPFEQAGNGTGCRAFADGFAADKYAATVRQPPLSGANGDLYCFSQPGKDAACAFNLLPQRNASTWAYAGTTQEPFYPASRPWYLAAEAAGDTGQPTFVGPYENYHTDHPVFGYTRGVFDGSEMGAAVLVLQYLADSPCYKNLCVTGP